LIFFQFIGKISAITCLGHKHIHVHMR